MDVAVVKRDCEHICHSEEQLQRFLDAGWAVKEEPKAEEPKAEKPKKATKKD